MQKHTSSTDPKDNTITRQEARELLHALDKPEFSGLMDNYINEISDPNNVKETNQFLKESEERKDLPSNVKLCKPTPGFCIKSEKYSIKRPGNRQKVFINICSYTEVPEPKADEKNMWSLPHLLNKGRHDQDKNKKVCTTFDVVFNPKAITLANENIAFKKFVCDTAINGINNQLLAKTEEKISGDFVVKSKINYKGLEVSYINIHSLNKGEFDDRKEPTEFHKTEIMKEVERIKSESQAKEENKEEEEGEKIYDQPDVEDKDHINKDIEIQREMDIENKRPIYKIKYSDNFDINNFFYQPEGVNEVQQRYKRMIIDIETPRMNGAGDAELAVDVKQLKFAYKDIYQLEIDLPIEIKKESVKAKFDKTKKVLSISADIVHKEVVLPPKKEDENIEIVKDEKEEQELERERKKKEEEEKKKKEEEEERIKKEEEEKKKKEEEIKRKKEEEERKKEEEQKNKEVFIKGQKKEPIEIKNLPLKEVKYKLDEKEEETNKENKKKLVEEIPSSTKSEAVTKQTKDEDDVPQNTQLPQENNNKQIKALPQSENTTPIVFLSFNNDWVYEVE